MFLAEASDADKSNSRHAFPMSPSLFPLCFLFLSPQALPGTPAVPLAEPQPAEAALLRAAKQLAEGGDLIGAAKVLAPAPKRVASPACAQQRLRYLLQEENLVFAPARDALKAKRPDAAEQLLGPLFQEEPSLKTTRRMMAQIRAQRADLFIAAGQPALALAWMQGASLLDPAYAAKAEALEGALENILQGPVLLVIQDASMNQLISTALEDRLKTQARQYGIRFSLVPANGQRLAGIQIPKPDLRDQELRRAPQLVMKPGFRSIDNDEFNRLNRDLERAENDLIELLIQRRRCPPVNVAPAAPAPASLKKACSWLPDDHLAPQVYGWPSSLAVQPRPLEPSGGIDRGIPSPRPSPVQPSGGIDRGIPSPVQPRPEVTEPSHPPTPKPSQVRPTPVPRHVEPLTEVTEPSRNTTPDASKVNRGSTEGVKPGAPVVDNRRGAGTVTKGTTQPADGPWNTGRIPPRNHPAVPPLPPQDCPVISCDVFDRLIIERECEIRRLRFVVCQTPPDIQVPDDQQWAYQITTYERTLDGHAMLSLGQRRDQVSGVHEAIDQVTDKPNPNFNVPADPLILPSELEMTKGLSQVLSVKIIERIAQLAWQESLAELQALERPKDATAAMELDLMLSFARMKSKEIQRRPAITAADLEKLPKHP